MQKIVYGLVALKIFKCRSHCHMRNHAPAVRYLHWLWCPKCQCGSHILVLV